MKIHTLIKRGSACLMAVALIAIGVATTVHAATPTLDGQIVLRPLTPQEIKDYSLTGIQGASGLNTVGVGQPAYLEVLVNSAIDPADIISVTWTLTNKPVGSMAVIEASPLGTNIPTYKIADQLVSQVAGRAMLRPDKAGITDEQYTVVATIVTTSYGTVNLEQKITAGNYVGISACSLCHTATPGVPAKVIPWSQTGHATFFTRAIDGLESDHYGKNCISCHTVGYDTNTNAVNGGFDDVAAQLGWTFPTNLMVGNWANLTNKLQNLANIQCENCHGPGSQHAFYLGDTDLISVSFASGDCAQCHDSKPNHIRTAEWNNAKHAVTPRSPTGPGRESCVGCHTPSGFAARLDGEPPTDLSYEALTCAGCHDPHDASNPHQLRTAGPVTLQEGTVVTTNSAILVGGGIVSTNHIGAGILCIECHMSRQNATNYVEISSGSSHFGPHHAPEADMILGVNGITYGKNIPSSAHKDVVDDLCVHCHMQNDSPTSDSYLHTGGHTFSMTWDQGTNVVDLVTACVECHGPITKFDFKRQDYDGNGIVEGVQTEVRGLLAKLAFMLPPAGVPKEELSIDKTWNKQQLKAAYNYLFVAEDKSFGIHNLSFAVGLLKASIADMTGDANNDGIADWWQEQYFGTNWVEDPDSAPNATPAGDIYPNWLKYALGLNPNVPGIMVPDGVIWANAGTTGGDVNTVHIYTAAEIVFDTEVGKTYQIQGISSLGGGWQNIGDPIVGDGNSRSYVTPTRTGAQQFYRVAHSE